MQVRYLLDRNESQYKKEDAVQKIMREMGSDVSVSGDVITVDDNYDQKVVAILNRVGVNYSRNQ